MSLLGRVQNGQSPAREDKIENEAQMWNELKLKQRMFSLSNPALDILMGKDV